MTMRNKDYIEKEAMRLTNHNFSTLLLEWWDKGHADLPWRSNRDPYAVWIAEVMLQQTQITTVIPYYQRWMDRFPTVEKLASAPLDDVLKTWEGLGYYRRARNLHAAANIVVENFDGSLPDSVAELMTLPGIGRYTAGAIASIAYEQTVPVLDGNIIRVFSRVIDFADDVSKSATKKKLWNLAERVVPTHRPGDYNEALMELGQQICSPKAPDCTRCPLEMFCLANIKQIQEERPVRTTRRKIPHYDVVAGITWQTTKRSPADRFLIAQRPLNGMLGGLWEFPGGKREGSESLEAALRRELREELGIDVVVDEKLTTVKHAYTHFKITLHAFHARYQEGTIRHIGVRDHAWVTLEELDAFAFAAADRQIIKALKDSWPEKTA